MKSTRKNLFSLALAGSLFATVAAPVWAGPTAYQATGTVLAVTDSVITIEKGKEKWDIGTTQAPAGVKVGDKVTVHYTMTATSIDAAKSAAPAAGKAASKSAPAASPAAAKAQ